MVLWVLTGGLAGLWAALMLSIALRHMRAMARLEREHLLRMAQQRALDAALGLAALPAPKHGGPPPAPPRPPA